MSIFSDQLVDSFLQALSCSFAMFISGQSESFVLIKYYSSNL